MRLDERPADVSVLEEALAQRQPGLGGVPDGGRDRGVRHGDHQVGLDRVLAGQDLPHPLPHGVHHLAVDHAVRPGEVDVLERAGRALGKAEQRQRDRRPDALAAGRRLGRGGELLGVHALPVDPEQLARVDLADELRADRVERAALGGGHPSAAEATQAERPDPERVPHRDQAVAGQQHQTEGAG